MAPWFSRRKPQATALTASAVRINPTKEPPAADSAAAQRQLLQGWQADSFRYYNTVGEIWFGAQFYARGLQNVRLYVGRKDENNEIEEIEDNDAAAEILDDVQDPGGGRSAMLAAYGQLMWLIGEGYMLVTPPADQEAQRNQWEFVSPSELTVRQGRKGLFRQIAPGMTQRELAYAEDGVTDPQEANTGVAYRYWRRHPQFSGQADAPMRGVLFLCDELERLAAAVRARAVSRPAGAGLLLIPEEISQPPPEPVGDEDPEEDIFLRDLTSAMVTPIGDPGTASAVVPLVVRGAAEYLKELRYVQLHDPLETYPEEGLRTECIRRMAIGLDMPPEALTGLSDTNHWNGWVIDEDKWRFLQPVAQRFCEDLTSSYFRPACRDAGVDGWEDLIVWYDPAGVINNPDRGKDAGELHAAGALSDEAYREARGFADDDGPSEEELARYVGIKTNDSSLAWFGIPRVSSGLEVAPGELEEGPTQKPGEPPEITGPETEKAPPEEPVTASGKLAGAAELTLDRCRELAGSRLRTKITRAPMGEACVECAALIRDVPNALVAAALGQNGQTEGLALPTARELVAGGAAGFSEKAVRWGVDPAKALLLADQLEKFAARTLFNTNVPDLPSNFWVALR